MITTRAPDGANNSSSGKIRNHLFAWCHQWWGRWRYSFSHWGGRPALFFNPMWFDLKQPSDPNQSILIHSVIHPFETVLQTKDVLRSPRESLQRTPVTCHSMANDTNNIERQYQESSKKNHYIVSKPSKHLSSLNCLECKFQRNSNEVKWQGRDDEAGLCCIHHHHHHHNHRHHHHHKAGLCALQCTSSSHQLWEQAPHVTTSLWASAVGNPE